MKFLKNLTFIFLPGLIFAQVLETKSLLTEEIRIRDPYIYADTATHRYYMYAQMDNRLDGLGDDKKPKGVEVYVSSDLKEWQQPQTVLLLPDDFWARNMVWAPEMHEYNGKYYLFVTLTSSELHKNMKKPDGETNWPPFHKRGTQIFVAHSPLGPFLPFENKPHTPENWMALDGTLYVEDNKPYMIFCHEWVEIVDGSMDYIQLSSDLSKPVGDPIKMFHGHSGTARFKSKIVDPCLLLFPFLSSFHVFSF